MKKIKFMFIGLCTLFLSVTFVTLAHAQDVDALVTPAEVDVATGQGIQLEAFGFTVSSDVRSPIAIDVIKWRVEPDSLGTITEDGYFIAGRHPGDAKVVVTITIGGVTLEKVVVIHIGKVDHPFFNVKVVPDHAVVPSGTEKQFHVVVESKLSVRVPPIFVRWEVIPEDLGKISADGLFTAGNATGEGKVVAFVEVDGFTIRAAAKVVVSPPATGVISGNVIDDLNSAPLPGAVVRAIRLGRIHWVRRAETDSLGNYTADELIPGIYVLTANARDFLGEFYDDTRNYLEATPLKVAENDTLTGFDFGLSEGGKITGHIIADADSLPLAGVHVVAALVVDPRIAKHTVTDENGNYEISPLATGSYTVYANTAGYKGEFFDDAATFGEADFVSVVELQTTENIDFGLRTSSAIRGKVTKAKDGTPLANATIRVFINPRLAVNDHIFRQTQTDANGEYILQIREGAYYVQASAEGFNSEFFDNARKFEDATLVHVFADSHTVGIDFDLTKRGSIAGIVTDETTGLPIAGAVVEAFKENNRIDAAVDGVGFRAKTDSSGGYLIENVPAGAYLVVSAAELYLPEFYEEAASKDSATLVTVADDSNLTGIDFTLLLGGSISGLVASEVDSLPIAGALVEVWESETGFHRRAYSHEDGTYKVRGLKTGSYFVHVIAKGFKSEIFDDASDRSDATLVTVTAPNETAGIDFYLAPHVDRRGTIAGRVVSDKDDVPIMGAVIVAVSPKTRIPHIAFTGPFGFYRLTDLPAGRYFVFAWAEGFVGEFYDNAHLFRNADAVIVVRNQVTAGINFGLRPRHRRGIYTMRGRVHRRGNNMPLRGVLVQARLGEDVEVNAVTDINGEYVMDGLPAGDYVVEATGAGYADGYFGGTSPETATMVSVGNGEDASEVNMNLDEDNVTSVEEDGGGTLIPDTFDLSQNYPNPFNPETAIKYQISQASVVTLKIFNLLGQQVRTLVNKQQVAGAYTARWDGKDDFGRQVASGIYIYQIKAGDNFKKSRRMLLLK